MNAFSILISAILFSGAAQAAPVLKLANMSFNVESPNRKAADIELRGLTLIEVKESIDLECAQTGQVATLKSTKFLDENFVESYNCPSVGGMTPMSCKESERIYTGRTLFSQTQIEYTCDQTAAKLPSDVRSARVTVRDLFVDRLTDQLLIDTVVGGGCGTFSSYVMTGSACSSAGSPGGSPLVCQVVLDFRTDNNCEAAIFQTVKFDLEKVYGLVGADRNDFNKVIEFVKADGTQLATYSSPNGLQKTPQPNP